MIFLRAHAWHRPLLLLRRHRLLHASHRPLLLLLLPRPLPLRAHASQRPLLLPRHHWLLHASHRPLLLPRRLRFVLQPPLKPTPRGHAP